MNGLVAHGLSGRSDLPIPEWLFGWIAAIVVVLSFLALAALWRAPVLEGSPRRALPERLGRFLTSPAVEGLLGLIGAFLLGVTIWSGLAGTQIASGNFAPTFVYIVFWVGLVPGSLLLGDVFRALNPWRAIGRAAGALTARVLGGEPIAALPYPRWLGYLPAAVGLFAFAWLELVAFDGERPRNVAIASLAYTCVTFAGMGLYGVETWSRRGEAFGVYFGLIARISPFVREGRQILLRRPFSGLTELEPDRGIVLFLATAIGTVTFDGLAGGSFFSGIAVDLDGAFEGAFGLTGARMLTNSLGLVVAVGLVYAFYWLGCLGMSRLVRRLPPRKVAPAFVHSLVPIAVAYVGAHYVTLLLLEGQGIAALASDPLGEGWDLFGSASSEIDFRLIGGSVTWYLQVALVVAGHVAGLALAHDRALARLHDTRDATRSQLVMLVVMVGLTSLALWLLASANG